MSEEFEVNIWYFAGHRLDTHDKLCAAWYTHTHQLKIFARDSHPTNPIIGAPYTVKHTDTAAWLKSAERDRNAKSVGQQLADEWRLDDRVARIRKDQIGLETKLAKESKDIRHMTLNEIRARMNFRNRHAIIAAVMEVLAP